jgi:hypothetical protein
LVLRRINRVPLRRKECYVDQSGLLLFLEEVPLTARPTKISKLKTEERSERTHLQEAAVRGVAVDPSRMAEKNLDAFNSSPYQPKLWSGALFIN